MLSVRTIVVVLDELTRSAGVELMLLERIEVDGTRDLVDQIGGAVQTAGLTVVADGLYIVGLNVEGEPPVDLVGTYEVDAGLVKPCRPYDRLGVVMSDGQAERIFCIAALDRDVVGLHVPGTIVLGVRILGSGIRDLDAGVIPGRNHGGGAHPGAPRIL